MLATSQRLQKFLLNLAFALSGSCATNLALAQSVPMLVQAEAMSSAGSTAPMTAGYDIAAMGGRFITAAGGSTTTNPVRGASVRVDLPAGTYYLWARIAGPTDTSDALYVGIDTSFDRVFPSTPGPYEWVRVETSDGTGVHAFTFDAAGSHDIQVGYGEIGAKLDAVYLTNSASDVPGFAPSMRLLLDAESFNRTAQMIVRDDAAALGGQHLTTTTASATPVQGADVQVHVPTGTWYLWARIAGPTDANDAVYVGIDASFARIFPQGLGPYEWKRVPTSDAGAVDGFNFPQAGVHVIKIGYGEMDARTDAVYLTNDANEVPTFAPMRRVIEAESFQRRTTEPTMTVGTDAAANGGQYLTTTSTTNSTTPVREAWVTVNAPATATYFLWARLKGLTDGSDALYVGFNNSWDRVFTSTPGSYEWVRVENADGSGAHGFSLNAGEHAIQVGHGEVGARLDAVYVTDSATDTPTGATTPPPAAGFPAQCALPSGGYEGFGRNTLRDPNLPARQVYRVTSLADPGVAGTQGTLRDALSQPNRCVVFDRGGEIDMTDKPRLTVRSNVIIDGFTAPSPGITLVNNKVTQNEDAEAPLVNISGATDVVVRGIRIRKSPGDAIRIVSGASNVVVDRVSVTGFGDGAVDVTLDARNVTIQWSILGDGDPRHNMQSLIMFNAARVSVHHNLYIKADDRQPFCGRDNGSSTQLPSELVCDVRNNLVWNFQIKGTHIDRYGTANVINNYYKGGVQADGDLANPSRGIEIAGGGVAFTSGNVSHEDVAINHGNRSTAFLVDSADVPATTAAREAALAVKAGAGARGHAFGLDSKDQAFINGISIP